MLFEDGGESHVCIAQFAESLKSSRIKIKYGNKIKYLWLIS